MKKLIALSLFAAGATLAACNNSPSDRLARQVENVADPPADAIDRDPAVLRNQADMLANQARTIRDTGESRSDAIRAADMNVSALTPEQRNAIATDQAPAVR